VLIAGLVAMVMVRVPLRDKVIAEESSNA
jgi:hypothetical protein